MAYKAEIKAGLKKKHPAAPKQIIEHVSSFIEKNVKEETEVDQAVEDAEGLVGTLSNFTQVEGDRRVQLALSKNSNDDDSDEDHKEGDNKRKTKASNDESEISKLLAPILDKQELLLNEIANLKGQKATEVRNKTVREKLKSYDETYQQIMLKQLKFVDLKNDDSFEEYLGEIEANGKLFEQKLTNEKFALQGKPIFATDGSANPSPVVEKYAKEKVAEKAENQLGGKQI